MGKFIYLSIKYNLHKGNGSRGGWMNAEEEEENREVGDENKLEAKEKKERIWK